MSPTDASRLPAGYPRARSGVRASWGLSYRNPVNDIWLTSISVTITLSFIRKSSMAFLVGAWVADGSMLQLYARSVLAWRCSLSPLASGPPGDCHEPHLSPSLERCAEALRGGAGERARRAGRRFAECKSDAVDGVAGGLHRALLVVAGRRCGGGRQRRDQSDGEDNDGEPGVAEAGGELAGVQHCRGRNRQFCPAGAQRDRAQPGAGCRGFFDLRPALGERPSVSDQQQRHSVWSWCAGQCRRFGGIDARPVGIGLHGRQAKLCRKRWPR